LWFFDAAFVRPKKGHTSTSYLIIFTISPILFLLSQY
jgi:hypothetical protein